MRWTFAAQAVAALLVALLALALASGARAQETGGSFGGGDWGDPGPSLGTGGAGRTERSAAHGESVGASSPSPFVLEEERRARERAERERRERRDRERALESDDDERPAGARRSRSGGLASPCLLFCCAPLFVGALLFWVIARSRPTLGGGLLRAAGTLASSGRAPRARSAAWNGVDLTQLRLAVDWRARRFVQQELAKMATSGRTATSEGRVELLRATIALLRRVRVAWLYAGEMNFRPMAPEEARGVFTRLVQSARAKFRRELVRADGASTRTEEAGELRAREHEGPGVVMISLIVAARREIHDFRPDDVEDVDRLLASLESTGAGELVAFEVIWSPAAEDDRMSTAELEAIYPDVTRIGGIGGRVFCGYCGGPFAMELPRCPHCGAPGPSGAS